MLQATLPTLRSSWFPIQVNRLLLTFYQWRDPMKIFWIAEFSEMAESNTFCVKWGDNHDSANGTALRLVFVEIWAFRYPKTDPQNVLQNANFKASFVRPLRAKSRLRRHWDPRAIKALIKEFKKSARMLPATLPTLRSSWFPKKGKSVIFGILAKKGPHENFLDS